MTITEDQSSIIVNRSTSTCSHRLKPLHRLNSNADVSDTHEHY